MEEIKYKNIFIDGTKIEANANKYTFVWKKAVYVNDLKIIYETAPFVCEFYYLI